jgi:GT2 family glycosyltransferase
MIQVSIIIVNYNTAQWVDACIESIIKHTSDVVYEIIVVDNASREREIESLLTQYPNAVFIQQSYNIGFGRACNDAVKQAKGEYIFFLNPDTQLLNNAIKIFRDFWIDNDQSYSIACLGAQLKNEEGRNIHSYGNFPQKRILIANKIKSLIGSSTLQPELSVVFENGCCKVDYITGADLFVSKQNFEKVQGFDNRFFMYFEETDLQFSLAQLNLQSLLVEGASIVHKQGASNEGDMQKIRVLYFDSLLLYVQKYSSFWGYQLFRLCWYILDIKTVLQKATLTLKINKP